MFDDRDRLLSQSKSIQFCVNVLKSGLTVRRQHHYVSSPPRSAIPELVDVPAAELLDQAVRVVRDCSERLYIGFMDSIVRHSCRPEHRWLAHISCTFNF